jgi:hypothetical protein
LPVILDRLGGLLRDYNAPNVCQLPTNCHICERLSYQKIKEASSVQTVVAEWNGGYMIRFEVKAEVWRQEAMEAASVDARSLCLIIADGYDRLDKLVLDQLWLDSSSGSTSA